MGIGDYTMQGMANGIVQSNNLPLAATATATQGVVNSAVKTKPVRPINVGRNNPHSYISQSCLQSIEAEYHEMGITHTRIALCHAQVSALVKAMAQHVLPIDLEEVIEAQEMLQDMARDRVNQLNGDHPDVEKFWDVYEYLQGNRSPAFGLNHHQEDAHTVAINLLALFKA